MSTLDQRTLVLLDLALVVRPKLEVTREDVERLADYAVQPPYPVTGQEYTPEEARLALEAAAESWML